jgi:hypothetical protein
MNLNQIALFLLLIISAGLAPAQETSSVPGTTLATEPGSAETLTNNQIRELIRKAAEKDIENDKKQRDYTYIQREEEHKLDGKDQVKSTETRTYEIMVLYEEAVRKLIAKDDQPLSENDARKEDEKIQKIIEKRKGETEEQRKKRLQKQEKDREEGRKFVKEIADAYNFRLAGMEEWEGRSTSVIDADPRPGYEPHMKNAKFLPKFRFRVWIDKSRDAVGEARHPVHRYRVRRLVPGASPQGLEHPD